MATVKIILEPGETIESVKEELAKALELEPSKEKPFQDPLIDDIYQLLNKEFINSQKDLIKELHQIVQMDDELLKLKKS